MAGNITFLANFLVILFCSCTGTHSTSSPESTIQRAPTESALSHNQGKEVLDQEVSESAFSSAYGDNYFGHGHGGPSVYNYGSGFGPHGSYGFIPPSFQSGYNIDVNDYTNDFGFRDYGTRDFGYDYGYRGYEQGRNGFEFGHDRYPFFGGSGIARGYGILRNLRPFGGSYGSSYGSSNGGSYGDSYGNNGGNGHPYSQLVFANPINRIPEPRYENKYQDDILKYPAYEEPLYDPYAFEQEVFDRRTKCHDVGELFRWRL